MILGRNREILKHLIAISGSGLCVGNDEADRRGGGGGQEEERSKWLGEEKLRPQKSFGGQTNSNRGADHSRDHQIFTAAVHTGAHVLVCSPGHLFLWGNGLECIVPVPNLDATEASMMGLVFSSNTGTFRMAHFTKHFGPNRVHSWLGVGLVG